MRAALWLLALFGMAVAVALFAGNNQSTVTLFWPSHRIDLSLNLVLLLLLGGFVLLHAALRAVAALLELPHQAKRWRRQQKERATHAALLDGITHLMAGRFIRARKAAESAVAQEKTLGTASDKLPYAAQLRTLSHLVAAESAQALQDRTGRDDHLQQAMSQLPERGTVQEQELREGAHLRAARWSLDDRDTDASLNWLAGLPQGAARRTLALRIRLKATRLARRTHEALETARLLAKHRAFSASTAQVIVRGLAIELINSAHDTTQLLRAWQTLEIAERAMPELAIHAAQRLNLLGGDAALARTWLLPTWDRMAEQPNALPEALQLKLIHALEAGLSELDAGWLARIETAHQANPRSAALQYLAGMACLKRQLWGKARQLLTQSTQQQKDAGLRCNAWRALAVLAEQRGDAAAAAEAWKSAALAHEQH